MPKFRHIVTVCSINLGILLNDKANIYRKETRKMSERKTNVDPSVITVVPYDMDTKL